MTHPVTPCNNVLDWNPLKCAIHIRPVINAPLVMQEKRPCACHLSECVKYQFVRNELLKEKVKELVAA